LRAALDILTWLIVARALLTWVPNISYNPIVRFIHEVTEPVMRPIQKILPQNLVPFSPIVAILVVRLVERLLVPLLFSLM